ncbi:MAG: transglutaminase family protein [Verrucomicrobiota bacterium]
MSIRVALNHLTHYRYDHPIGLGPQVIRLRPAPHARTPVLSYSLKVDPKPHFLNWQQDPQGNYQARVVFPEKVREFRVEVDLIADMAVINPFDFFLDEEAKECPFHYDSLLDHELAPFLQKLEPGEHLAGLLKEVDRTKRRTIDFLVDLNSLIYHRVKYSVRMEPGVQTPEETLERGVGSCRDTSWLLVQVLRHLGLAARFVSGYLIQLAPDIKPVDGPVGVEKDFTDLHAWAEVYLPGAGWIGLDGTSGLVTGEGHIPLAATPEPASAAPITGSREYAGSDFEFDMSLSRIEDRPRTTKPYSEGTWQRILKVGDEVDERLEAGDVRLTMGGEPTFNSAVDMEGEEWNTAALSEEKTRLANELLLRLRDRWAPGALLHHGQGKWYPGEPLPRWALGCYWRLDGEPIWRDPDLIADGTEHHATIDDARALITAVAAELGEGVDPAHIRTAYEDAYYFLWRERKVPVNQDPYRANLSDDLERRQMARLLERGLGEAVGCVLPLEGTEDPEDSDKSAWQSAPWYTRTPRLQLVPGDSPMGLRLPLDSLPWIRRNDYPYVNELDPTAPRDDLPAANGGPPDEVSGRDIDTELPNPLRVTEVPSKGEETTGEVHDGLQPGNEPPELDESEEDGTRTALCVELRDGGLHVFMPPVKRLEEYLALVTAVERAAKRLGLKVRLEGYTPPHDHRVTFFKITPDPGVIEVNLQPSRSWRELVENTTSLYHEARQLKLGAEKFMIDGRHVGTGGGNHMLMGGAKPADSPLLRRPDLMRSMVTYWQHHPSLSYLFSGLFIGPTSQSPRVDEARHESLYELELAFRQMPKAGDPKAPWTVDRLLRNLLIDVSGNTHRAEFCIDKLYPGEEASRRLGLVELRAFEMPPHERMSVVQQLLLRSLLLKFWEKPYEARLIRWGTELHDKFMLHHFIERDFKEVIDDLAEDGIAMELDWFIPHLEFRFPILGSVTHGGITIELRAALEPWYVLGEAGGAQGTSRSVDSSLERIQVMVSGMTNNRHLVTVNGRRVPLHPTGAPGEFVGGVRYRAWKQPDCLHPNIPEHSPLTFDLYDTWNQRSLGGCVYHVSHPGGLSYDKYPVNAFEAESRRINRFHAFGHSPGRRESPPVELPSEYHYTLDLRVPVRANKG